MLHSTRSILITDTRLRPNAIAFCDTFGANLIETRKNYILLIENGSVAVRRYWSKDVVKDEEDAIDRAQRSLNRVVQKEGL